MDRGFLHAELRWTLGRVEVIRYDVGDQRTLSLNAPDHDMWGASGEPTVQAVNLEELDELIAVLQAHRQWLDDSKADADGWFPIDPINNYRFITTDATPEHPAGFTVHHDSPEPPYGSIEVGWAPDYISAIDIAEDIEDHRGNL